MRPSSRTVLFALVTLVALTLAACGRATSTPASAPTAAPASRTVIIGYSAPGLVGAQLDIQHSLEDHAKAKGWQLITTTSGGDAQKQVEQIKNFLDLGVSAIVAVPDDSKGICAAAAAAKQAGVPFYTIDRSPEGCAIDMAVLADNYLAGQQSAEALVAFLTARYGEPRGTVLEITGNMAQNVARLRGSGFRDALASHAGVQVVTEQADWDTAKGAAVVAAALSAYPKLDAIYMHSDAVYMPGTLDVLREGGRLLKRGEEGHIFLAGVDGSADGVQAIKDGWADQVSNQPIPDFGIVADWIERQLQGEAATEGEVVREGALWSPAHIKLSDVGPQLFLATTSVTEANMNDPGLWANQ